MTLFWTSGFFVYSFMLQKLTWGDHVSDILTETYWSCRRSWLCNRNGCIFWILLRFGSKHWSEGALSFLPLYLYFLRLTAASAPLPLIRNPRIGGCHGFLGHMRGFPIARSSRRCLDQKSRAIFIKEKKKRANSPRTPSCLDDPTTSDYSQSRLLALIILHLPLQPVLSTFIDW